MIKVVYNYKSSPLKFIRLSFNDYAEFGEWYCNKWGAISICKIECD